MNATIKIIYDKLIKKFDDESKDLGGDERIELAEEIIGHLKGIIDCVQEESAEEP